MPDFDYDLFVIGAGSGGVRAARVAAQHGARVGVAEEYRPGGTCVVRGCVPKKFMVYASEYAKSFKTARGFGWRFEEPTFDWRAFLADKDKEIQRLSDIYAKNLNNAGADLILGRAQVLEPHALDVEGRGRVTAGKILVATGGRPWIPDIPGAEFAITSNGAFHLPDLPRRIVIAGGGYIAVEFAFIFAGLGVETTLVHRGPAVLRGFDEDVRAHVTDALRAGGVTLALEVQHERIEKTGEGLVSHLTDGRALASDVVMFALGRVPLTEGLGLETAGVDLAANGAVKVDAYSRTNVPNIFAVGDVTDRINLTPVAIREGHAFADTEFGGRPTSFDHEMVACAVFSQPPVGSVGLSEADARARHGDVDVYASTFRPMKETFYGGEQKALIKLVVEAASQRVLGCHVVGPDAPEIIQMAAIAMKMGVTKSQWDAACAVHPTLAEELVTMRDKRAAPSGSKVA